MASFRFNFGNEENEDCDDKSSSNEDEAVPLEAKEVLVPENVLNSTCVGVDEMVVCGTNLLYVDIKNVEADLKKSSQLFDATPSNTDLVPAVYEGGLKVWECTVDLIEFLDETKVNFEGKRVIEVGCGAGLPGIYALLQGALVDFQDYNDQVLERFTIRNVFINLHNLNDAKLTDKQVRDLVSKKCHFYAGDWKFLTDFINPSKTQSDLYDIILTSETIYSVNNYHKLLDFIRKQLRYPQGVVYVAAKTYYFGVGGGTRSFEDLVKKSDDLDICVRKTFSEGLKREILMIKWKQ